MSNNDSRQPGYSWVSPYLTVVDAEKSLDFYQNVFGFELKDAVKDDSGKVVHGELVYNDQTIMLGTQGAYGDDSRAPADSGVKSPVSLYVYCDDVDAMFERATKAGATVGREPEDSFWGDRMCQIADPEGHQWCFARYQGK